MSANYYRVCSCTLPYSDPTACERCGVFRMPTITTTSTDTWSILEQADNAVVWKTRPRTPDQSHIFRLKPYRHDLTKNTKGTDERYK